MSDGATKGVFLLQPFKKNTRHKSSGAVMAACKRSKTALAAAPTLLPVGDLAATCASARELSNHVWFEGRVPLKSRKNALLSACYSCGKFAFLKRHGFYTSMCAQCGQLHYDKLVHVGSLPDTYTAVVIGGRTKIGYQVALRLLRAGATVVTTTRFPERCVFDREPDYAVWSARLSIKSLDLNQTAAEAQAAIEACLGPAALPSVDALFIVAAQTIRGIERREPPVGFAGAGAGSEPGACSVPDIASNTNRYGDAKHFCGKINSWCLRLGEVTPEELEEVMRVNTVGPFLLVQTIAPRIEASDQPRKAIVLTHAREGMFDLSHKSSRHPHTNVAKAGLHMVTHMIQTTYRSSIPCYGVDPGWISVDEYGPDSVPMGGVLPLTELDGAAKLTDVVLCTKRILSTRGTIRHYAYGGKPVF
jgi:NAD(P)-dependent dehydrogenase (short-subunit alcohol dehydrogenase family)